MPIKRGLLRRPLRIQRGRAGGGTSLDPGARGGGRVPASEGIAIAGWCGREADGAGDRVVLRAGAGEDALVRVIGDGVIVRDCRPLRIQRGRAGGGTSLDPGARGGGRVPASEGIAIAGWCGREADGAGDRVVLRAGAGEDALVRVIGDGVIVRDRRPVGVERLFTCDGSVHERATFSRCVPTGERVSRARWISSAKGLTIRPDSGIIAASTL